MVDLLDYRLLLAGCAAGVILCAWNLATSFQDYVWAVTSHDSLLALVARGVIVRTLLYFCAQAVVLIDVLDHRWGQQHSLNAAIMLLVLALSVHDRILRYRVTHRP